MKKIEILVVEDHTLVRDGIVALLKKVDEFDVIGEASNGLEATNMVEAISPDVVLMDISMPEMSGIEALRNMRLVSPEIKVILLSVEITQEFIAEALEHGVKGYIPKDISKQTLIDAIMKVNSGEEYFDPRVSEVIFKNFYQKKTNNSTIIPECGKISKREEEILTMIGQGYSNLDIADKLFISVRTVDAHRSHIMKKMGLKNTVELIRFAIKSGIIPL